MSHYEYFMMPLHFRN